MNDWNSIEHNMDSNAGIHEVFRPNVITQKLQLILIDGEIIWKRNAQIVSRDQPDFQPESIENYSQKDWENGLFLFLVAQLSTHSTRTNWMKRENCGGRQQQ